MRFNLFIKKANLDDAVAFCIGCFTPLSTHKQVVNAYNKKDKKQYRDVYTFCKDCIVENSEEYEELPQ